MTAVQRMGLALGFVAGLLVGSAGCGCTAQLEPGAYLGVHPVFGAVHARVDTDGLTLRAPSAGDGQVAVYAFNP